MNDELNIPADLSPSRWRGKSAKDIQDKVAAIFNEGAPAAAFTLVQAAAGFPVRRESIVAAEYVINRTEGRPREADRNKAKDHATQELLDAIRKVRMEEAGIHSLLDDTPDDFDDDDITDVIDFSTRNMSPM